MDKNEKKYCFVGTKIAKLKSVIIHIVPSHCPPSGNVHVILLKFEKATTSWLLEYLWSQKSNLIYDWQQYFIFNFNMTEVFICNYVSNQFSLGSPSGQMFFWKRFMNSVKRSDVTRWKQGYITAPPPYFIVLASSVKTKEVKVIECHRINFGDNDGSRDD